MGKTNNPNGRPKGSYNARNALLRQAIDEIVANNVKGFTKDLKLLKPKERVDSIISLMSFVLPKLQSIDVDIDNQSKSKYERLIDEMAGVTTDKTE